MLNLIISSKQYLNQKYIDEGRNNRVKKQDNFKLSKIDNDYICDDDLEISDEEVLQNLKNQIISEMSKTYKEQLKLDINGPILAPSLHLIKNNAYQHFEGSILVETNPKKFCKLCILPDELLLNLKNINDQYSHYQKIHDMYLCVLCGELFENRKQEAAHRIASHVQNISENSIRLENQLSKPKRKKQLKNYQSQNLPIKCIIEQCRFESLDQITLSNHIIFEHGDIDETKLVILVISKSDERISLEDEEIDILKQHKIFSQNANNEYIQDIGNPETLQRVLLIKYNEKLIAALKCKILQFKFERYCIIENIWNKKSFKLELFILIDKLSQLMAYQRVTEIFHQIENKDYDKFFNLKFFKIDDQIKKSKLLQIHYIREGMHLISRKTICSQTALIPDITTPKTNYKSEKAQTLREFIQLIKDKGIINMLKDYLQIQIKRGGQSKNQKANRNDQALTTNLVFDRIYKKLLVTKTNMFDCCPFIPDWDAQFHYNSLKQPWHGEFVWCNPPYSQTSQFITKALIEFLEGKSVVMLIPEPRKHDGFTYQLLTLCGDVHKQGLIRFDPYLDVVQTSIQLIYLIQPGHIEFLEAYHKFTNKIIEIQPYSSLETLQYWASFEKEQKDNSIRLFMQGLSVSNICKITGISRNKADLLLKNLQGNKKLILKIE